MSNPPFCWREGGSIILGLLVCYCCLWISNPPGRWSGWDVCWVDASTRPPGRWRRNGSVEDPTGCRRWRGQLPVGSLDGEAEIGRFPLRRVDERTHGRWGISGILRLTNLNFLRSKVKKNRKKINDEIPRKYNWTDKNWWKLNWTYFGRGRSSL